MKIVLDNTEKRKLNEILDKRDSNLESSDFYSLVLDENYDIVEDNDFLTSKKENEYFSILMNKSEISINTNELLKLINNNKINIFHQLDENKYLNNPYYKNIPFKNIKENSFMLDTNYFDSNECFLFDEVYLKNDSEINNIGFFNSKVKYLTLQENDTIWMSITPYEINTMEKDINKAKGKVLTLGLGLGYFQYMISNKEEVKEITIVEKSKKVISIFTKHILPYFKYKDKIKIINDDAFNFLNKNKETYDFTYFDIHHDENEGLLYLLELINNKVKLKNLTFWIEKSILILVRRYLLSLIEEYFQGYTEKNYLNKNNDEEIIISSLYKIYSDININSIDELAELITLDNIKKKLYSFFN